MGPCRATTFFKIKSNFMHPLCGKKKETSKTNKLNTQNEKELRNNRDAREEQSSVGYPSLSPLFSCER